MAAIVGSSRRKRATRQFGKIFRFESPLPPLLLTIVFILSIFANTSSGRSGFRDDPRPGYRPAAQAIRGAKIHPTPDAKDAIPNGTLVIRNGLIEAVGPVDQIVIPDDAEVIDGKGLIVTAGWIDLHAVLGASPSIAARSAAGAPIPLKYSEYALAHTPEDDRRGITPEYLAATALEPTDAIVKERRALGFTDLIAAPGGSIASGVSVLTDLSGLPRRESIVKPTVALQISLKPPGDRVSVHSDDHRPAPGGRSRSKALAFDYPMSLMGVVAHLRQAMIDAERDHELDRFPVASARRPFDPALKALHSARTKVLPVWWEADSRDEIHRVLDLAEEFGTTASIIGGREAWKVADRLKAKDVAVVLRLNFADEPKAVPSSAEYRKLSPLERGEPLRLRSDKKAKWKEQVACAKKLAAAGVRFGFSTDGLSRVDQFPAKLNLLIAAGLSREAALDALTRRAAEIAGVGDKLGTLEVGKLGHVVVATAPPGDESAKIRYVLIDGEKFELNAGTSPRKISSQTKTDAPPSAPKRESSASTTQSDFASKNDSDSKKGKTSSTNPEAGAPSPRSDEKKAALPKPDEKKTGAPKTEETKAASATSATKPSDAKPQADPKASRSDQASKESIKEKEKDQVESKAATASAKPKNEAEPPFEDVATELDEDREPKIKTGGNVFIKNATILTVNKGTIPKGSILVRGGKIAEVGPNLAAPEGIKIIDAAGMVAMPGIIDTHSHISIQGGVNEISLSIVPEVRVRDVVTGDEPAIYRALAGGVTIARLLHGSADVIGGQDAVIKLRHGAPGRELLMKDVPQGVKFALGENVTRRIGRFPNTRMGVEAVLERAFEEARAYREEWNSYGAAKAKGTNPPPPRRDLRLEALAGVLDGSIKVHTHCYRADEILTLLRVAARHGVKIQSLQHVLEGYKVAAEIAEHGASCSTFSDWWAYKVEAFDAIPYNAALLTEAGASVCIKSDDEELMRHLALEAAKMVRYGDLSEKTAMEMITINPARQLGLDARVGSIEVGKDADIAIFNGHPFDAFSRCEMTLVDGEVYFQRGEKFRPRGETAAMPAPSALSRAKAFDVPINPKGVYAIVDATLHPVSGPDVAHGTIVVAAGKIAAIGGSDTPIPQGATVVQAKGLDVWPGMFDASTVLGLFEIGSLPETQDHSDSATIQPELLATSALRVDSALIPVTRANGVLSAFLQPDGGLIAGQGGIIGLGGWVPAEMVRSERAALVVNIPTYVPASVRARSRAIDPEAGDPNAKRRERLDEIKRQFRAAIEYDRVRTALAAKGRSTRPDPRLEALAPYARGEKIVLLRADRAVEIFDALALVKEFKLKAIVTGGLEAWKTAEALKAAKVPVIVAGVLRLPDNPSDPYDAPYANPARLRAAGVPFAIASNSGGPNQATAPRNLPYDAATAVAFGLSEADAIQAVTLGPARLLGVADQFGSLEVGKRADLVVTAGHLLQPTTDVKVVLIDGKPIPPQSRQTRLYAEYRRRLAEIRAGSAKTGTDHVVKRPAPVPAANPSPPTTSGASSPASTVLPGPAARR